MIKSYYDFLLESVLHTSKELKEILQSIDDVIAKDFVTLIDNDIKTPYNALNTTDKNDTLSFSPDNQFQRKIGSGQSLEALLKDDSNKTSVGRLIQKVLKDNGKNYDSNQVTAFTDKFKAAYLTYFSKDTKVEPIRVVEGDEIRKWYLYDTYNDDTLLKLKGTLGKSCMRYDYCLNYFDIYVQNPDVCKLVINTILDEDGEEKLVSRALLWKTNESGWYLDRVYFTDASEKILIKDFVTKNFGVKLGYDLGTVPKLTVQLTSKTSEYYNYPYMDSFPYYDMSERKLYNFEPKVSDRSRLYEIRNTDGTYNRMDQVYCELDGNYYSSDEVIWSEYHQCDIPSSQSVYSYHSQSEIFEPQSCYSNALEDYLPDSEAREVYLDVNARNSDFYPIEHKDITYEAEEGGYYLKELLVKVGVYYYLPKNLVTIYTIVSESKADFCRIFNKEENIDISKCYCSEAVSQGFGFKISKTENQMPIVEYLRELYGSVIFDVLESRFSKLLKVTEYSEDITDEIYDAKYHIHKIGLSASLNYVHKLGGLDAFVEMYKELLNKTVNNTTVFSKTVRKDFLFDIIIEIAESSGLSEFAIQNLLKSTKVTIHKIITNHLYEFLLAAGDISGWLVNVDSSKANNIKKIIEDGVENFEYLKESEIAKNIFLLVTARVIFESTSDIQGVTGWDMRYSSINFFFKNPNKLKLLDYNP